MRAERFDDVLRLVRLLRVPHKPNGDDFWRVHQHAPDLDHLTTLTLVKDVHICKDKTLFCTQYRVAFKKKSFSLGKEQQNEEE